MAVTQQQRTAPPMKITGLLQSKWANQVLKTAVELDLFSALSTGASTAGQLATRVGAHEGALERLLQALVAMEFLRPEGEKYTLTELSHNYLVKSSPLYFGEYVLFKDRLDEAWNSLTEIVKTGRPFAEVNCDKAAQEFFPKLAEAIFPINFSTAEMVADHLRLASAGPLEVLDLAAGTAVWSVPAAQANKQVKVDALDFPAVIEVTKAFAQKFNVEEQFNYLVGNWRDIKIEQNKYDIIYLGHILHCEGKKVATDLMKYVAGALKPGGKVVVAEFITNTQHNAPTFAALFAINMMVATTDGCTFSLDELTEMFQEAGLKPAERLPLPCWGQESPVVLTSK